MKYTYPVFVGQAAVGRFNLPPCFLIPSHGSFLNAGDHAGRVPGHFLPRPLEDHYQRLVDEANATGGRYTEAVAEASFVLDAHRGTLKAQRHYARIWGFSTVWVNKLMKRFVVRLKALYHSLVGEVCPIYEVPNKKAAKHTRRAWITAAEKAVRELLSLTGRATLMVLLRHLQGQAPTPADREKIESLTYILSNTEPSYNRDVDSVDNPLAPG